MNTAIQRPSGPLYRQLCWFITLRWVAVSALAAGAVLEGRFGWFGGLAGRFAAVAAALFIYNLVLWRTLAHLRGRRVLRALALGQLLLDMVALAALVAWTGGIRSPLCRCRGRGFVLQLRHLASGFGATSWKTKRNSCGNG